MVVLYPWDGTMVSQQISHNIRGSHPGHLEPPESQEFPLELLPWHFGHANAMEKYRVFLVTSKKPWLFTINTS